MRSGRQKENTKNRRRSFYYFRKTFVRPSYPYIFPVAHSRLRTRTFQVRLFFFQNMGPVGFPVKAQRRRKNARFRKKRKERRENTNRTCAPRPLEKLGGGEVKKTIARPKLRQTPSYPTPHGRRRRCPNTSRFSIGQNRQKTLQSAYRALNVAGMCRPLTLRLACTSKRFFRTPFEPMYFSRNKSRPHDALVRSYSIRQ